ncbi:MAG: TlpA disulfide reductase family protein, partial [Dehalococcoidia bacterium]
MNRFVDWRRLALAAPLLVIAGVALYALVLRGDASAGTRRALLADTPPGIEDSVGVRQGQLARDFVAVSPDGTEVRLSDLRGTPVIINFWASWCTSCLAEMPEFHDLQQRIGVDNLQVVAINTGESADTAQEFVEKLGVDTFRIALDPTLVVADAYGVFGMPTSIFLDADGVVRATYAGHIPGDTLEEFV